MRRRCEIYREGRRAASPLFWTLGGQQVGKAAITGWRDVLAPGLSEAAIPLAIWPFEGRLAELCRAGNLVALETYPTEFYTHLGVMFSSRRPGRKSGKRVQEDRAANFQRLSSWAKGNDVALHPALVTAIRAGFGSARDGEDQFDAVIGLFGMLNVVLGNRGEGWPIEDRIREVEGWILGQSPGDQNGAPLPF